MIRHLGEDLISHSPWRISERGPWQSKEDPTFWHVDVISGGLRVARVSGVGRDRALANAQLIVATPELLGACKEALIDLEFLKDYIPKDSNSIKRLKQAMTKTERVT